MFNIEVDDVCMENEKVLIIIIIIISVDMSLFIPVLFNMMSLKEEEL